MYITVSALIKYILRVRSDLSSNLRLKDGSSIPGAKPPYREGCMKNWKYTWVPY